MIIFQTIPTFEDGVWIQDCTPLEPGDGKRYIIKLTRNGEELIWVRIRDMNRFVV